MTRLSLDRKTLRVAKLAALAAIVLAAIIALLDLPVLSLTMRLLLPAILLLLFLWAAWRFYRRALWTVGRRLAFSYFLTGVLPIPLLMLVLGAVGYLLCGFLLGHLFDDGIIATHQQLENTAGQRLAEVRQGRDPLDAVGEGEPGIFAYYLDGKRLAGDKRLPATWPDWALPPESGPIPEADFADRPRGESPPDAPQPGLFYLDGEPTLVAHVAAGREGVLAAWAKDLDAEISRRAGVWTVIHPLAREDNEDSMLRLQIGTITFRFRPPGQQDWQDARKFFLAQTAPLAQGEEPPLWDQPLLMWAEAPGPVIDLTSGAEVAPYYAVTVRGTLRTVRRELLSTSAELDASLWMALFVFAFLLFDVYVIAAIVAAVMIFTLSQAVGRLSSATRAVSGGDFSTRIPVKRKDQVGELQRSFNSMTEHLEELVSTATEKELLEKELEIARQLQQSLLPRDLPGGESVEFSTLFAPSAAIGGDYFDVLSLGAGRLAVVVADVSGHGLPTGLRMAMVKAALTILSADGKSPVEIFHRLDELVRQDRRVFVTATIAVIDLHLGVVEITNAGHPPTYRLRDGEVDEILLPGSPLGGLGRNYGHRRLELAPGEVLLWLSDGLIEAVDADNKPFGYEAVRKSLTGPAASATQVRDRLLAAIEDHTGGRPVDDDRTVVVMRYHQKLETTSGD
ncbi:MAG: SpoIIE family protein phosphatase [Acidobacteriota bacterium]